MLHLADRRELYTAGRERLIATELRQRDAVRPTRHVRTRAGGLVGTILRADRNSRGPPTTEHPSRTLWARQASPIGVTDGDCANRDRGSCA
jgi:hypothetical protein